MYYNNTLQHNMLHVSTIILHLHLVVCRLMKHFFFKENTQIMWKQRKRNKKHRTILQKILEYPSISNILDTFIIYHIIHLYSLYQWFYSINLQRKWINKSPSSKWFLIQREESQFTMADKLCDTLLLFWRPNLFLHNSLTRRGDCW